MQVYNGKKWHAIGNLNAIMFFKLEINDEPSKSFIKELMIFINLIKLTKGRKSNHFDRPDDFVPYLNGEKRQLL